MKRELTHENFEHFLKQNADNLRMKAPEKVWQNVSRELHKRRRRLIIGLSTFLFMASVTGYYLISHSISTEKTPLQSFTQQLTTRTEQPVISRKNQSQPSINKQEVIRSNERLANQNRTQSFSNKGNAAFIIKEKIELVKNSPVPDAGMTKEEFTSAIVDSDPQPVSDEASMKQVGLPSKVAASDKLPYTIESVVNSYKLKSNKARWETQLYITPTISYRKLTENKSYLRSIAQPSAAYPSLYSSVNSNVTHKPDVGFELGFAAKYALSNNIKLRGGLQFNVNRYDVKAFSSSYSLATIALNNGVRADSLNTLSNYSNVNGYKSNWLQNLYFQVSAPVGLEVNFKGNDKVHFGIASTIQPTYVLGDRAYLITTDYKNYAQVPWLVRRWNVNTALETFVVYNSGKTRWQVGPQVRYQLLSSFISKYPVKENLFDFGLKVGVSLNK